MKSPGDEKSRPTEAGGSSSEMNPVLLHPRDQSEGRHRDLVCSISELELVGKPHDVQARVHGGDVDAERLAEPEVGPAQLVDVHLENVTEVYQHVTGPLGPAGDVQTGRDHVGALPAAGEVLGQGQLEEVEGHVDVIRTETELLGESHDLLPGVLESDLPRLPADTGAVISAGEGVAPALPVGRHEGPCRGSLLILQPTLNVTLPRAEEPPWAFSSN